MWLLIACLLYTRRKGKGAIKLKKLLSIFLVSLALILSACGSDDIKAEVQKPEEAKKQSEMTELEAINYLGQVTYRLIEAGREDNGSDAQKGSLNAAIGRSESLMEEIKEQYENGLPIAVDLIELADLNKQTAEKALGGDEEALNTGLLIAERKIEEFADKYLDGEVPLNLQHMNGF